MLLKEDAQKIRDTFEALSKEKQEIIYSLAIQKEYYKLLQILFPERINQKL